MKQTEKNAAKRNSLLMSACAMVLAVFTVGCDDMFDNRPQTYQAVRVKVNNFLEEYVGAHLDNAPIAGVPIIEKETMRYGSDRYWCASIFWDDCRYFQDIPLKKRFRHLDRAYLAYDQYQKKLVGVCLYRMFDTEIDSVELSDEMERMREWLYREYPEEPPTARTRQNMYSGLDYDILQNDAAIVQGLGVRNGEGGWTHRSVLALRFFDRYFLETLIDEQNRGDPLPQL